MKEILRNTMQPISRAGFADTAARGELMPIFHMTLDYIRAIPCFLTGAGRYGRDTRGSTALTSR